MEDLQERQENEVNVLKSIYSNYFCDLRELNNAITNKKKPNTNTNLPFVKITLFPVSSQSQHEIQQFYVQIDLKIKFSADYPNELPIIFLENEKGLSSDHVKVLHRALVKKANELKGREMIYELCQEVQEFLYNNNKPPTKSFYDQRIEEKLIIEKQRLEENNEEKNKVDVQLIAEIDQAVDLKKKMLQMERKKEKELEKRERLLSNNSPSRLSRTSNNSESEQKETSSEISKSYSIKAAQIPQQQITNIHFKPFQIEFKEPSSYKINCIKLITFNLENSLSIYRGIDQTSNEIFNIYEWKINLEKNRIFEKKKLDVCYSEIEKIKDEFTKLSRLNNKLLVKYLAFKYFKEQDKNNFIVQLLTEYVEGSTIELFINKKQSYIVLDSTLRTFLIQLIDALDYLHSSYVVHRDLKPSCVHIERNSLEVKLSEYGLIKRLNNLNELVANDASNIMTGNIKSDIHQLGLLVLSLSIGEQVQDYHPQVPTNLPPELRSFISLCLKQLDKIDCKFLRNHPYILKTPDNNPNAYNNLIKRTTSIHYDDDEDGMKSFTDYSSQSRLNTEFEVIGVVGQGAYGEVLKVKNKLDSRFYAIKRIRINPDSKHYNKLITREIKLLSRLNHENVVRYYSTWVEQYNEENYDGKKKRNNNQSETFASIDEEEDDSSSESSQSNHGGIAWSKKDTEIESFSDLDSDSESISSESSSSTSSSSRSNKFFKTSHVSFDLNTKDSDDDSDDIIFAENSTDKVKNSRNLRSKSSLNKKETKNTKTKNVGFAEKKLGLNRQYIYIQMEYCGGKTLKDLIENGLYKNEDKVWSLFREILQGLNHIHEQGMIHRDLKPGNVLIDTSGHAKIGDFGLATSKFKLHKENLIAPSNGGMGDVVLEDNLASNSLSLVHSNQINPTDSLQLDSLSLSGAVGTALYVAPELMVPSNKNKYIYTQKVDIYSLGIMFYEMCFPFSTNMERIHVIQGLRLKDSVVKIHCGEDAKYEKQLCLIKLMLNHDPNVRPSAKELLLNEMVPRKADEIALDELLQYSFSNKQSTNYKKILKAIFEQKNSKIEDASFDATNCKPPSSFKVLQIREYVFNQLLRIFQKHGGYMISYPFLTPCNDLFDDFNKVFKLTDSSGLVLSLPYNHRIPFARYLARSGCTNIKRYYIGKIFTEKLKLTSLHPREHMEASFDIVASNSTDCLPEIEILTVLNDAINSFTELVDQNYILVINHTYLLNSIFSYCGINESDQKNIYYLLAEYNNKIIKSHDASKENRVNWFKDRLPHLNLNEHTIERLLNFLLKTGEPEKILSEMRTLTKNETNFSKLAKEAIIQLKSILNCISIMDLKIQCLLSPSFVLPVISHPFEYSGFVFQLLVRRKNNKNEYDILASGGRYDNMISKFRNKQINQQNAVGVSFDFEKIVFLINDKSKQNVYRSEMVVCSIGDNSSNSNLNNSNSGNNLAHLAQKIKKQSMSQIKQIDLPHTTNNNSLIQQEIKNRLRLFKFFLNFNKNLNLTTHLLHEKFNSIEEVDEYCKKHCISSYTFLNDTSSLFTSQIFLNNQTNLVDSHSETNGVNSNSSGLSLSPTNQSFIKIRSLVERGFRYIEKKTSLNDFLSMANTFINQINSITNLNPTSLTYQFIPWQNLTFQTNQASNLNQTNNFLDLIQSITNPTSSSTSTSSSSQLTSPSYSTSLNQVNSSSALNFMSQVNVTMLLEPSSKQQTCSNSTRRKLELQILNKLNHIFSIFSSKTRIELIIMETPDNVIQALANNLHLEMEESNFNYNWNQCLDKINNPKYKKQLCNFKLDEIIHDLRYLKRSKVLILYSLKSDQFKLLVSP